MDSVFCVGRLNPVADPTPGVTGVVHERPVSGVPKSAQHEPRVNTTLEASGALLTKCVLRTTVGDRAARQV